MSDNENLSPAMQAALKAVAACGPDPEQIKPFHPNAIRHNIRVTKEPNNVRIGHLAHAIGCAAVLIVILYMIL